MTTDMQYLDRFLGRCVEEDRGHETLCWVWQGARDSEGYGGASWRSRVTGTHRIVFTLMHAEIPQGLTLDHLCRVRACCNPWHLEPVTTRVNTLRSPVSPSAVNANKSQCFRGHSLANARLYRTRTGWQRKCRACERARAAERREQAAAA